MLTCVCRQTELTDYIARKEASMLTYAGVCRRMLTYVCRQTELTDYIARKEAKIKENEAKEKADAKEKAEPTSGNTAPPHQGGEEEDTRMDEESPVEQEHHV